MYIFELEYPGAWLKFEDHDIKNEIEVMLRNLEGILVEVAISLHMYEVSASTQRNHRGGLI